jgi:hypothetical protein
MTYLEIATLHLNFPGAAQAPARVLDYTESNESLGTVLACWRPEIGPLNKLLLLRSFEDERALFAERANLRRSENPFGCGNFLLGLEIDSYATFDGLPVIEPGAHGPNYEVRTYRVRPGGLFRLIPEWVEIAPSRSEYSTLLTAAYALDGPMRMIHIWPYHNLEERASARAEAAQKCDGWPTPSGADWIDPIDVASALYLPILGSPLR